MSDAWPLHVGAMIVFGAMVITLAAKQKGARPLHKPGESYFAWWSSSQSASRTYMAQIIKSVSMTIRILCAAVFIYTLVNFALFIKYSEGGGPFTENGKYYLKSHGHIIRELSEQEFYRFRSYELRGFSGHWILFSFIPAVYFLTLHRSKTFVGGHKL
jgi:hypothetical protein